MAALPFDPLASRGGRLASFFFLYVSEGLPYGFTTVAVATQMRRAGLGPAEIGAFVAALYLPWAFKWIVGPIVDTVTVERFGPRRFWILLTQILMAASLLAAMPVDLATQLALYTALIVLHNVFAATQDVAIDALACGVLPASERGVASGFMFGGQAVGKAIGGGGVLYLGTLMPFAATYFVVAAAILLITLLVVVPIRERLGAAGSGTPATDPHAPDSRALLSDPAAPRKPGEIPLELDSGPHGPEAPLSGSAGDRLAAFLREAWQAFAGRRAAWLGLLLALLPMGAMGLGLALQTTLAVELGLSNAKFGLLGILSALTSAVGCVAGGWMSDRLGRRRMSGLFIAAMSLPTVVMALTLAANGISEVELGRESAEPGMMRRPIVPEAVLTVFWGAVLIYNLFQGLMYGATTALFMDLTTPRVAGTQFTAYMALSNLAISFSAWWQGIAIERLGFPTTLGLDAVVGILGIGILPFLDPGRPVAAPAAARPAAGARIHSG